MFLFCYLFFLGLSRLVCCILPIRLIFPVHWNETQTFWIRYNMIWTCPHVIERERRESATLFDEFFVIYWLFNFNLTTYFLFGVLQTPDEGLDDSLKIQPKIPKEDRLVPGDLLAFGGFFSGSDKTRAVEGGILVHCFTFLVMFQKVIFSISLILNRFDLCTFYLFKRYKHVQS